MECKRMGEKTYEEIRGELKKELQSYEELNGLDLEYCIDDSRLRTELLNYISNKNMNENEKDLDYIIEIYDPTRFEVFAQMTTNKKIQVNINRDSSFQGNATKDNLKKSLFPLVKQIYEGINSPKGFWLHGDFQKGKSFVLSLIAKEHLKRNKKVAFYLVNDLLQLCYKSMNNFNQGYSLDYYINKFKNIDVLVLDDIGAETLTDWGRDNVLYPIIEYRVLKEKKTYFSSNMSMVEYITTLINDDLKAKRLLSRLMKTATEIYV